MRQFLFPDKSPLGRLGFTIVLALTCFLIGYFIASWGADMFFGAEANSPQNLMKVSDPANLGIFRYYQIVLSVCLFLIPAFILAWFFSGKAWNYLYLNRNVKLDSYLIVLFTMIVALPFINFTAYWNEHIRFPEFLSGIEAYFIKTEKAAKEQTFAFLNLHTPANLIFNLFMVALLPAIGEELMFRGILQRLFTNITHNAHWGIFITSFLFSAIHFQFYGLFPRWMLGALFGYLLLWSGSLWLPIAAHFFNNAIAVMGTYFAASEKAGKDVTEIGATPDMLPAVIVSVIMLTAGLYLLYNRRRNTYTITD